MNNRLSSKKAACVQLWKEALKEEILVLSLCSRAFKKYEDYSPSITLADIEQSHEIHVRVICGQLSSHFGMAKELEHYRKLYREELNSPEELTSLSTTIESLVAAESRLWNHYHQMMNDQNVRPEWKAIIESELAPSILANKCRLEHYGQYVAPDAEQLKPVKLISESEALITSI